MGGSRLHSIDLVTASHRTGVTGGIWPWLGPLGSSVLTASHIPASGPPVGQVQTRSTAIATEPPPPRQSVARP